ncbi:hypothetical protein [Opitutus terrae]|uniref:Uncharacterized protein n=1 Tax=Opitutus terrae (strain DSM 11246 / JCM 15787 / PB90-1) TaxID=452637 RepID=B1ZPK8_OPITP|nr:hypothetical protein [Opitutus terrae]ACB74527.1 hypothetical protein Oter_1242 [Opitutus terrae PB90-1]
MNSTAALTGSHLRTYQKIFENPASREVAWSDVHSLFRQLGAVEINPDGVLTVARNGQSLILHAPHSHAVADTADLLSLRNFLARSEPPAKVNGRAARWLVVIARHEARIYRSAGPRAVAQLIRPPMSEETFCQSYSTRYGSTSRRQGEPSSLYEPVAGVLSGAGQVFIFCGTGTSTELDQFTTWLQQHRPELARRIVGSLVVNERTLSEDQLLAKARVYFAQVKRDSSSLP